mgnify:CR=1 FL=1|jgi:hypothetical protein
MKKRKNNKPNFAGIPRYVIRCDTFKSLSGNAVKLLIHLAYQYKGKNNGDLQITHSLLKEYFKSNQTMYRARDELEQKGFIAINVYGGMSYGGYKVPTLYAITWEKVNDFIDLEKNTYLYSHLATNKEPSKCFIEGKNTKYKNTEQKKSQYKKDVKKANIKRE